MAQIYTEFVGVSGSMPVLIKNNGSIVEPGVYFNVGNYDDGVVFDDVNKLLVHTRPDLSSDYVYVVDCSSNLMPTKNVSSGLTGSASWLSIANGRMVVADYPYGSSARYRLLSSYADFTGFGTPMASSWGTSGRVRKVIYGSNGYYYYTTASGEIGKMTQLGNQADELHDSDAVDFNWLSALYNKIIGYDDENDGRFALYTNETSWANYDLNASGSEQVYKVLTYGTMYSLVKSGTSLADRKIYYVNHSAATPVGVDITPSGGYLVYDIAVDGTNIYASVQIGAYPSVTYFILKKSSLASAWEVYLPLDRLIGQLFKY